FKLLYKTLVKKALYIQTTKVRLINQFYAEHEKDGSDTFIKAIFNKTNVKIKIPSLTKNINF
ncbi:MAG: hypothetical protein ACUVQP_06735, partial [Bacteroidales bacterium]